MANFLNKLGDIAKNAADKTGDMIEVGKLNAKISSEQATIATIKQKIGGYYYEHFEMSEEYPPEVSELCQQIKLCEQAIAGIQGEISALKGDASGKAEGKCPACKAVNSPGTKFCGECGARL